MVKFLKKIPKEKCRLCKGILFFKFQLKVLKKFKISYYECIDCGSLQTEKPYWLNYAYAKNNLANTDTGAAQRNINNLAISFFIAKLFKIKNIIDYGGGDGLLCRLLRDYNINCYIKDKYATANYAQNFTNPNFKTPDMILAFEVIEHFSNPNKDLKELFSKKINIVLVSTVLYKNSDKNWWYLSTNTGQHVFFYSQKSLEKIAHKFGYKLTICGEFFLFTKKISKIQQIILKLAFKSKLLLIIKGLILTRPASGALKDHILLRKSIEK